MSDPEPEEDDSLSDEIKPLLWLPVILAVVFFLRWAGG